MWVNEDKTSPYEYYQYFRNISDDLVEKFLKIFTEIPLDEIARLSALQGAELNVAKKVLAFAATEIAQGTDAARAAEEASAALVGGGANMENVPCVEVASRSEEIDLLELITEVGLVESKSEGRRLIQQGGFGRGCPVAFI